MALLDSKPVLDYPLISDKLSAILVDKMLAHLANLEISVLLGKFLPSGMEIKIMLPGNYLQHNVVCLEF
jgi:hypothetical protein